jgi:hypothetical protein
MAYIGSTPTTQSFISGTDYFNGDGTTVAFTLTRAVSSVNDIEAVVNNVVQQPNSAYTISGTTITFTSAPSSGTSNVYVRYLSTTTQAITPSQNSVGTAQLGTITNITSGNTSLTLQTGLTPTTGLTVNTVQGVFVPNCFGVGGATPATSGAGITFPATQSASTDANTLDDYEEGDWTATVSTGGISSQSCSYVKIGKAVTIIGNITFTGGSVSPDLAGLPFTPVSNRDSGLAIYSDGMEVSAGGPIMGYVIRNQARILFYSWINNGLGNAYQSSGTVIFSCTYFV